VGARTKQKKNALLVGKQPSMQNEKPGLARVAVVLTVARVISVVGVERGFADHEDGGGESQETVTLWFGRIGTHATDSGFVSRSLKFL
jgi:hypothetical protein